MDELPLSWRLRRWLSERLPRWLAIALGIRRTSPSSRRWPIGLAVNVPPIDTGGAYRAKHRKQDPAADPTEPYGSESSSAGDEHGWSGCTMSAGADAIAYQQPRGSVTPWGGDLRHRQSDLSGGTDLYDLRAAWAEYGETLTIKSGGGWSAVDKDHRDGQAIVAQGTGNVPGSQTFDGGHACSIAPETHSDGRWLFGDPLASDWQWVEPSSIRSWMERMSSGCYYAVGEAPPAEPEPPTPGTPTTTAQQDYDNGYSIGRQLGEAHGRLVGDAERSDLVFRSWSPGGPFDPDLPGARWGSSVWSGPGEPAPPVPIDGDPWASWPLPIAAVWRAQYPAAWGSASWAGAVWRA